MTYLFKLARRLAFARPAAFLAVALMACSDAAPREFLSPDPDSPNPSSGPIALVVVPGSTTLPFDQTLTFRAYGRLASGDSVATAVSWTATDGVIGADGLYRGTVPGTHVVTAYAIGKPSLTGRATITVTGAGPLFTSLRVQPEPAHVHGGAQVKFGATAQLQSGANTAPNVSWQATGGTITSGGDFKAGLVPGQYAVIATTLDGVLSDTVQVVVEPPALAVLRLQPRVITMPGGDSQDIEITSAWTDGSTQPPPLVWETSSAGTITPLAAAGAAAGGPSASPGDPKVRFTADTKPGNYKVVARHPGSGKSDTAYVTITPVLESVELTPASVSLLPGVSASFQARGKLSDGTWTSVAVAWQASGGSVTGAGVYTAGSQAGTWRVIATGGGLADTSVVQISQPAATLNRIILLPASGSAPTGGAVDFTTQAEWSDGSTALPSLTWTAQAGTVTPQGRWTAPTTPGTYRIVARHTGGTLSDTAVYSVAVPAASLATLVVSPGSPAVQGGQQVQFTAAATWTDGSTTLPALTWSATGGVVTTSGRWTAPNVSGVYRIVARATTSGLADTAVVTVSELPQVTAIQLTPGLGALASGTTLQLAAALTWSDGLARAASITWTATKGTISMDGLFTAGSLASQAMIIASCAGCTVADTSMLTITEPVVTAPVVTQFVLNPGAVSLAAGAGQVFQVNVAWSDGSTATPSITWTATGGTMQGATYTAGSTAGTFRVIAREAGGTKADTSTVTITAAPPPSGTPTVTKLNITPQNAIVDVNTTRQFSATASMSDGGTTTPAIQWSATGGTISSTGLYSAGGTAGPFLVIATCGACGRTDTTTVSLTVPPPPPGVGANDRVIFPSPEVEFIVGPQLKAGSSFNPWPWHDANMVTTGLVHGAAFPVSPSAETNGSDHYINRNYYDLGLALYTAYYRTGNSTLLAHARKVADSWWQLPQIGSGTTAIPNSTTPRNASLGGLMLRAMDGRPEMWPWITDYVRHQYDVWVGARLGLAQLHYGVRDGGYMLLYAAWIAKAHPNATVRAEFAKKALDGATQYYARLQYADGSWRWTDAAAQTTGPQMQPFMVGLLLDGMVATHRLTGDPRILSSITKSVENLYTVGYRGNEPVNQKPGATWRGMWYTIYGDTCQSGCGRKTLDGGWDTNGIREVRQLNPTTLHAFGYAYAMTQDPKYRQWGDEIFASTFGKSQGQLTDAYYSLADFREKEYNAAYRSSGRYLAWRLGTP